MTIVDFKQGLQCTQMNIHRTRDQTVQKAYQASQKLDSKKGKAVRDFNGRLPERGIRSAWLRRIKTGVEQDYHELRSRERMLGQYEEELKKLIAVR